MEYSNGWRLSNGKRIWLPYILRDKNTLVEIKRFQTIEIFAEYAEKELKLSLEDLKLSRDRRFLMETPNHYLEQCGV